MERPSSRQLSLPSRPESGLAEWAEKIKAIQRQVDDDEAEEQRRLEDEIRASRLARKRRSHGVGSRSATPAIVDEPPVEPRSPTRADDEDFRDYASRQRAQADALSKLSGPKSESVSLASFIGGRAGGPRLNKHAPQADAHDASQFEQRNVNASTAPHPIFGRGGVAMPGLAAKGRTVVEPEPPAPAAPSFTDRTPPPEDKKPRERRVSTSNNALKRYMDHVEKSSPVLKPEPIRTRTFSTPAGPPLRSPPASAKQEYGRPVTPKTAGFALAAPATQAKPVSRGPSPQPSYTPKPAFVPSKPSTPATSPKPPATSPKPPAPAPKPSFTPSAPSLSAPSKSTPIPSPATSPKPAATIPTPSLARPVQPNSKPPPFGPRTPPSVNASAAFSRMPQQKDPTPSISRLKGRGFVASIVQASAQLEGGEGGGGEGGAGVGGERRGGKRLSMLAERWAPSTESVPASPPAAKPATSFRKSWTPTPTPSVKPAPAPEPVRRNPEPEQAWEPPSVRRSSSRPELRKSVSSTSLKKEPLRDHDSPPTSTEQHRVHKSPSSRSLKHKSSSHSLKHKSSTHSLQNKSSAGSLRSRAKEEEEEGGARPPSPGGRPMGSSSTMISYIKPMKTGDNDDARSSVSAPSRRARDDDVRSSYSGSGAGARKDYSSSTMSRKARSDVGGGGVSPGKPLSHLTKDRAKRPKKKGSATTSTPAPTDNKGKATDVKAPAAQSLVEGTTLATDAQPLTSTPAPTPAPTQPATTQPASTPAAPTKRTVADRWASQAVLGVRQPSSTPTTSASAPKEEKKGMVGARALPGLALPGPGMGAGALKSPGVGGMKSPGVPPKSPGLQVRSPSLPQPKSPIVPPKSPSLSFPNAPSPTPSSPKPPSKAPTPPARDTVSSEGSHATPPSTGPAKPPQPHRSPSRRRERIPSTGSRARVMEVAQMLHEREASLQSEPEAVSPVLYSPIHSPITEVPPRREVMVAPPLERRRSSFEAFGSLPVLKEVRTPVGSVAMRGSKGASPLPVLKDEEPVQGQSTQAAKTVTIKHPDHGPLPPVDVAMLGSARSVDRTYKADGILTISVEVLSITGASATSLPSTEITTFYDTEILAIVHRYKSKSNNGLVNTKVWAWYGRKSNAGELEVSKLGGLARRYGVGLVEVRQGGEGKEVEMVGVLGGRVAVRQGSRTHWSAENTTMHIVRSLSDSNSNSAIVIMDELDLSVSNLCSGYSFCLTLLGSSYVWHGRGSRKEERAMARVYAKGLSAENNEVVELREGEDDDDELFWMMLGEKEYAGAEYWRWRSELEGDVGAKGWRVDAGERTAPFAPVETFVEEKAPNANVYLLDCFFEMFVMVGKDARSKRADIRLCQSAAEALSRHVSSDRPFAPPVHVLVLPSRTPADLRFHFRDLDENTLNDGDTPDHMNLLTSAEAVEHLQRATWNPKELSDERMLPLGIHPSDLP